MAAQEYSSEQIEQWREQLEVLAQQPRTIFSKKQAVEALIEQIEQALSVHSYEEVARQLKNWGLEITAGSLKQYVTRYRREQSLAKTVNKAKRKRSNSQVVQASEQQGESNLSGGVNSIATTEETIQPQFEILTELSNIEDQNFLPDTTWAEPTFNRNRVRPQRMSS